jgi:hypothetical protein
MQTLNTPKKKHLESNFHREGVVQRITPDKKIKIKKEGMNRILDNYAFDIQGIIGPFKRQYGACQY